MSPQRADRLQTLLWSGIGLALLGLLWLLRPVLTPFLLAGILAYVLAPFVEGLARQRIRNRALPQTLSVMLVMLSAFSLLALLVLILVPLIREESHQLIERLPEGVALWNQEIAPWLKQHFQINLQLNPASLKKLLANNSENAKELLRSVLPSLRDGGLALLGILPTLLLTPVVMFYLLLDGQLIRQHTEDLVPRPWHARMHKIFTDIDAVLAEFLRGQISVMLALAAYYCLGLWLAGVDFALPVGLLTGLLIFIPYLGFGLGLVLALLVATLQFEGLTPLVGVAIVYGLGQVLESVILTPWLVGQRIGLHPLALIFALLAFGQLFGFFGILLALPASAALLVGLRELRIAYFGSRFYLGETKPS